MIAGKKRSPDGVAGVVVVPGGGGQGQDGPQDPDQDVKPGHLPALNHGGMDPGPVSYTIRIDGHLGATVLSAFPALAPRWCGGRTVLTGLQDRSALYRVLAGIEVLGLNLLEVRQHTPHRESPPPGDGRPP